MIDLNPTTLNHWFNFAGEYGCKRLEAMIMTSTSAASTIEKLRMVFTRFGLPEVLVTDNDPQVVSEEFEQLMHTHGIRHFTTTPYQAASNGLAEKVLQTVKKDLIKQVLDEESGRSPSVQHRLANFLFQYLSTPHTSTGKPPALMFL